jgi:hypothetical protein
MTLAKLYEEAARVLEYFPDTGLLIWKKDRGNKVKAGDIAGTIGRQGYVHITVRMLGEKAKTLKGHKLAWLIFNGEMPTSNIDHINRIRSDNRINNLRIASYQLNNLNTTLRVDNKSGFQGVKWKKDSSKWVATIGGKNRKYLGAFNNIEDAIIARKLAYAELINKIG